MLVRIMKAVSISALVGKEIDMDDEAAMRLIREGSAVPVRMCRVETAVIAPAETASGD